MHNMKVVKSMKLLKNEELLICTKEEWQSRDVLGEETEKGSGKYRHDKKMTKWIGQTAKTETFDYACADPKSGLGVFYQEFPRHIRKRTKNGPGRTLKYDDGGRYYNGIECT